MATEQIFYVKSCAAAQLKVVEAEEVFPIVKSGPNEQAWIAVL